MDISFQRTTGNEARIICDNDWIGHLLRHRDVLKPGSHYYIVHLFDDPRGPIRVHDRSRIREATETRTASLPHLQGGPPRTFNADNQARDPARTHGKDAMGTGLAAPNPREAARRPEDSTPMTRPTTWFTPLDRPPFVAEHHDPAGAPAGLRVLEISSRSDEPLGRRLSAMHLRAAGPDGDRGLPVESIYQAAKCYGDGGPDDQPITNGYDAKRHDRERRSAGPLRGFHHQGTFWPAASGSAFYDRLWIQAAAGASATRAVQGYDAYSDQFHRPGQSVACQARSAAMLAGLDRARQLGTVHDPEKWAGTLGLPPDARPQPADRTPGVDTAPKHTPMPEQNPATPAPDAEARVLVCGSRDFSDRSLVDAKLDEVRERLGGVPMRVISGAARGADTLAADWARKNSVPCDEYPAEWERYGRSAGYRRNERMLTEGRPHLVVAFPQGESRGTRMMMDIAAKAKVAVEEIDPVSRTTLTDSGKLYDVAAIARRSAVTGRPAGPVEAPGVGRIARLPNNDPRTHGEARIVIGGVKAGADQRLVHAKLDELLARAHPAALRIAVAMQPGREDLSTVAASWARRRGIRCDQYRTADPAEADLTPGRMIAEQKPHAVVTFPRGEQSVERLAATAAKAGVPVEAVDAAGRNHTRTGKLADLQRARQSRERAEPNPAWVVPIEGRTAAETNRRLGTRATDAAWAKPGHTPEKPPPTLNLRDRSAYIAVQDGEAVRIDRKTDWGSPFPLRDRNDPDERREVVEQYRSYLANAIDSGKVDLDRLARLDGKQLACHCAPQPCHGDVLSQAAAWAAGIERDRERTEAQSRGHAQDRAPGRGAEAPIDTHVFDPGSDDWNEAPAPDERAPAERPPADMPHLPASRRPGRRPARNVPDEDRRGRRKRQADRGDRRRRRGAARQRPTGPHRAARRGGPAHAAADAAATRRVQPDARERPPRPGRRVQTAGPAAAARPAAAAGLRAHPRGAGAGNRLLEPRQPPRRLRQARRGPPAHRRRPDARRHRRQPRRAGAGRPVGARGRRALRRPSHRLGRRQGAVRGRRRPGRRLRRGEGRHRRAVPARRRPRDPRPGRSRGGARPAPGSARRAGERRRVAREGRAGLPPRGGPLPRRGHAGQRQAAPGRLLRERARPRRQGRRRHGRRPRRTLRTGRPPRHHADAGRPAPRPGSDGAARVRYAPGDPAAGALPGRGRTQTERRAAKIRGPRLRDGGHTMIHQLDLNDHPHTGAGRTVDPDTPKHEQLCEMLADDGHLLAELGDPITGHLLWLAPAEVDEFGLPEDAAAAVYWTNGCDEAASGRPQWRVQALTPLEAIRILTDTMSAALDHVLARCEPEASREHPVRHLLALDASRRHVVDVLRTLAAR